MIDSLDAYAGRALPAANVRAPSAAEFPERRCGPT
jgi:hypothetical protein